MEKYDSEEHELIVCSKCGVVSNKDIVKFCTKDENDSKVAYLECPVCDYRVDVEYNY